jgi:hypothetical protein
LKLREGWIESDCNTDPVETSMLMKTYSPDVAIPKSCAASIISLTVSGLAHKIMTENVRFKSD